MTDITLRARQEPLKQRYRTTPESAVGAEGDLDFRGTLAVDKETPVGFSEIRLAFELDTDAGADQLARLVTLTERYCVVLQTINTPPPISVSTSPAGVRPTHE